MHTADLKHTNTSLQDKLHKLYTLNRDKTVDMGFRPPYLRLLEKLGNPHLNLPPIIHIAGTNGKGSTLAMLQSMLEAGGYNVHKYTSPHLIEFNERIILSGKKIENDFLESLIDEVIHANENAPVTFFEITTAIAFAAFNRVSADLLLLEVGLGGRLDCTNIIPKPYVSVISKISHDHQEQLGETLAQISAEKGGIIKNETPCIVGYQLPDLKNQAVNTLVDISADNHAPLYCAGSDWSIEPDNSAPEPAMLFKFSNQDTQLFPQPNLAGHHQIENAGLALATLEILKDTFPLPHDAKAKGLQTISWPGRLEHVKSPKLLSLLPPGSEIWYDGGHNDSAGQALAEQTALWKKQDSKPLHIIIGMKADKNPEAFLSHMLKDASSITHIGISGIGKCIETQQLETVSKPAKIPVYGSYDTIHDCLTHSELTHTEPVRVLICGSLYLAEKIAKES